MKIAYTIAACPLGRLLVAATERGVCFAGLGDADADLEAALASDFPGADIRRDDAELRDWASAVLRYFDDPPASPDVPLDIAGTQFQRRVWDALRAIPYGSTRSYGQLARGLGEPGTARAVGRACATNPVSLVIPCHRAVGEHGKLTGYRWGLERKRALLIREEALPQLSLGL
ncbi:MAG: methylated-DNA--[protein]-cysteine S-methyltransferase [Chloroflexota bacterium]